MKKSNANIKIIGVGGAGCNAVNHMIEETIEGVEFYGLNTDIQALQETDIVNKIQIGKKTTDGLGAGAEPSVGRASAEEDAEAIKHILEGTDMVFITAGMGGGTGTGAAPFIAKCAKEMGILTVGVVTKPFSFENRDEYADEGIANLQESIDSLIVIPNNKLRNSLGKDVSILNAFMESNKVLFKAVKGIAELVTRTGLVNLDFADVRAIMSEGGVAMIGVGESDTDQRAEESVQKALENPLIDVDISDATGALINISGGENLTLEESRKIVETVAEKLDSGAKIIWGAQIYKDLEKTIKTMLIITGVKSEQIFGTEDSYFAKRKGELESELGIDMVK